MLQNPRKVAFVALLVAACGAAGWGVCRSWLFGSRSLVEVDLLCAKCGYAGHSDATSLSKMGGAARAPAFGPGYECPKCHKRSLYANPIICQGCGTAYLLTADAHGALRAQCPKCGKTP